MSYDDEVLPVEIMRYKIIDKKIMRRMKVFISSIDNVHRVSYSETEA